MKRTLIPAALAALTATALAACGDATAPPKHFQEDTAATAVPPALSTSATPDNATLATVALADAAQRIIPTLANERLAAKVGLTVEALAATLSTSDPRIIKFALDVARAAVDAYQARAASAAVEAPDLDAIRLALDTVEERLLTTRVQ